MRELKPGDKVKLLPSSDGPADPLCDVVLVVVEDLGEAVAVEWLDESGFCATEFSIQELELVEDVGR